MVGLDVDDGVTCADERPWGRHYLDAFAFQHLGRCLSVCTVLLQNKSSSNLKCYLCE
jgi:hypothetical protein